MWTVLVAAAMATVPEPFPMAPTGRDLAPFTVGSLRSVAPEPAIDRGWLLEQLRDREWPVRGHERRGPDRSAEARFVLTGDLQIGKARAPTQIQPEPGAAPPARTVWQLVDLRLDEVVWEARVRTVGGAASDDFVWKTLRHALADPGFAQALATATTFTRSDAYSVLQVQRCTEPVPPKRSVVMVGRGRNASVGVIMSPDGLVWTSTAGLPTPLEPIEVRTADGKFLGKWVSADAELGLALLRVPLGDRAGCTGLIRRLPIVTEPLAAWRSHRRVESTFARGFALREHPRRIVVDLSTADAAAVFDRSGGLIGLRAPRAPMLVLHDALPAAFGVTWGAKPGPKLFAEDRYLDEADPGYQEPPARDGRSPR